MGARAGALSTLGDHNGRGRPAPRPRLVLTYLGIVGVGVAMAIVVTSAGSRIRPTPQLATEVSVLPPAAECLGSRLVAV